MKRTAIETTVEVALEEQKKQIDDGLGQPFGAVAVQDEEAGLKLGIHGWGLVLRGPVFAAAAARRTRLIGGICPPSSQHRRGRGLATLASLSRPRLQSACDSQ